MYNSEKQAKALQLHLDSGPVLLVYLDTAGNTVAEIPGPAGFPGHTVILKPGAKGMDTINLQLARQASQGRGPIGTPAGATDHRLDHDLHHKSKRSTCPWCNPRVIDPVSKKISRAKPKAVSIEELDI